jgi:hypothetical protein
VSVPNSPGAAITRRCVRAGRLDEEMARTAPLNEGEAVIAEGVVRCRTSVVFRRLSYLRLSTNRICLVQHFALRPDLLIEVPREAVTSVSCTQGAWVRLDIHHEAGDTVVMLQPWEPLLRRPVVEPVLRLSSNELCDLLA